MATQAQIEANRRNSQLSTGPRTAEGKARAAHNALKHGVRAQAILSVEFEVLGENPEEFSVFLKSLVDVLHPSGPIEEMCVESIALGLWRQRRVLRAEIGYIARHQASLRNDASIAERDQANPLPRNDASLACGSLPTFDVLNRLMRYESHLNRQVRAGFANLTQLQAARSLDAAGESVHSPARVEIANDLQATIHDPCNASPSLPPTAKSPSPASPLRCVALPAHQLANQRLSAASPPCMKTATSAERSQLSATPPVSRATTIEPRATLFESSQKPTCAPDLPSSTRRPELSRQVNSKIADAIDFVLGDGGGTGLWPRAYVRSGTNPQRAAR